LSVPVTLVSVGVDEILPAMRGHVRLVQRCGVQHRVYALHAGIDHGAVGNRTDNGRERRGEHVEAHGFVRSARQGAHQGFAQVT
jgi:hypothetical protein